MNEPATWERPITIKRYLHPPMSERIFTLWAEGKILFGEVNVKDFVVGSNYKVGRNYYFDLESCFMWMLHGKDAQQFDFSKTRTIITEEGVPVHAVAMDLGDVEVKLESCCNTARKSTCFSKITITNNGTAAAEDQLMLMLRSGKEAQMLCGAPNGYVRHDPDLDAQKQIPATWRMEKSVYTDGIRYLNLKSDMQVSWDEAAGMIVVPYALEAGASCEFTFSLDMGEVADFDYETQKKEAFAFWNEELKSITKLPAKLANDPEKFKMIRHLVAQMLQSFAYPIGEEYVLSRQGGLMSIVWPSEAMYTIEALSRVGDFGKYIEPALSTHFDLMQQPNGEVWNIGAFWASVTAAVLYSFCRYCDTAGKAYYDKYRSKVFAAYNWIVEQRHSVEDSEMFAGGLFPAGASNDWSLQFQGWTLTDVFNLFALDALAETAKRYGDPAAEEVRAEHGAYLADMKRHFKKYYDACEGSDMLKIPIKPVGDDQELIDNLFPLLYHGRFIWCGVIDQDEDIRRVYKYMLHHDIARKGGLYGHMPFEKDNEHIWYFSVTDYYWHKIWMRMGEYELADEIVDANIRFAMSAEFNMQERYEDNSPYFAPWSPNISANGRLIIMMMDRANS